MPRDASPGHDVAVLDVGSNSVRLVIYRLEGRAIWTVFNEKVLAGLGRGVEETGRLSPEAVTEALKALRRFKAVLDAAKPAHLYSAATAAVRDAEDGPEFVELVRKETGLKLNVLSGEEEARYSALGVLAGAPMATGVVGDLGGSSLELIKVAGGKAQDGISLPLGPFSLGAPKGFDPGAVRAAAHDRLAPAADRFKSRAFHAVGGAWRSLALIHMELDKYPLKIVHLYKMSARDLIDVARFVSKLSKGSLEKIEGVSKRRSDTLPWAAVVMEAVIEQLGVDQLWISAYGIREGLLFEAMDAKTRALDPLLEGYATLGRRQGVAEDLGPALAEWLKPAFSSLPPVFKHAGRDERVMEAVCRLADMGARLHPDHRADLAFEQVLRAPVAGQTHPERTFIATAIHARYGGASETPAPDIVRRLLSKDRFDRARALGLAMRLGAHLSGRTAALLGEASLTIEKSRLILSANPASADLLLGEQTAKRANALGSQLKLELEMGAA